MFQWFLVFKTLWRWRRSVGQIMWEMKTCYRESRKQGISYTQYKRERLYRNCLPKHITEEMMVGKEVTGRWGRRSWQLADYRMEMRGYWKLKKETLDHALWRTGFGRGHGSVIRQTTEWMRPAEVRFPDYGPLTIKETTQSVRLDFPRRTLYCWTAFSWLAGKFHVSYGHLQSIPYSSLPVVDITDFCNTNSRLQMFPKVNI